MSRREENQNPAAGRHEANELGKEQILRFLPNSNVSCLPTTYKTVRWQTHFKTRGKSESPHVDSYKDETNGIDGEVKFPRRGRSDPSSNHLMNSHCVLRGIALTAAVAGLFGGCATQNRPPSASLRQALTFHASFDNGLDADFALGDPILRHAASIKKQSEAKSGLPETGEVQLAPGAGRFGHALRFSKKKSPMPFFRALKNVAYRTNHWNGTVSFWLSTDPTSELEPGFCDPIQVTPREWNDACFFVESRSGRTTFLFAWALIPTSKSGTPATRSGRT
jgi:hypothetical protein